MGTDAGIEFKAEDQTILKMKKHLGELDDRTNGSGLGVACVPYFWKVSEGHWELTAQTHWSYDGENGEVFVDEVMKWIRANEFEVELLDYWYA